MTGERAMTILCVATFEKGAEFLRECKRQGCTVLLLTTDALRDVPSWPREAIDEIFAIPAVIGRDDLLKGVSHVARAHHIDRIVALDDFDVETAALLREHLRVPGMGETTARYFRDKLAMRVRAHDHGVLVPPFVGLFNDAAINAYLDAVPGPWLVKPRSQAAAIGIRKATTRDEVWQHIDDLGDLRAFSLLEQFVPGDIYHVDSIVWEREVVFTAAHRYGSPPWTVAHQGGVFTTSTVHRAVGGRAGARRAEPAPARHAGPGARRDPHRVHPRPCRRPLLLPRDGLPGRRRLHRRRHRGRDGPQPVARVGEAGDRGRARRSTRCRRTATTTPAWCCRWRGRSTPTRRRTTTPRSSSASTCRTTPGSSSAADAPGRVQAPLESYSRRFLEDFYASAPAPEKATH